MDDALGVRARKAERDLGERFEDRCRLESAFSRELGSQILAAQKLHHEIRDAKSRVVTGIEHLDDMVALDATGDGRLLPKPLEQILIVLGPREQNLHGAESVRIRIEYFVDGAHTAAAKLAQDAITTTHDRAFGQGETPHAPAPH